jgi:transcriptional regulator with XRE-family HTH domain
MHGLDGLEFRQGPGAFGAAVRALRGQIRPEAVGISPTLPAVRRVPGLRRDELAGLAGVSAEHLKRLEQGRRRPSRAVVDALAAALRLDAHGRGQLRLLAGFAADPRVETESSAARAESLIATRPSGRMPRVLTAAARKLLDRVTDASWTVLAANLRWAQARCGGTVARHERNIAWRLFTGAPTNVTRRPEYLAAFQAAIVAELYAAIRRYPDDSELCDLVTDLRTASVGFARLWDGAEAGGRPTHADPADDPDRLTIQLPGGAPVDLAKDVLRIEPGDLRLVLFTPAADPR